MDGWVGGWVGVHDGGGGYSPGDCFVGCLVWTEWWSVNGQWEACISSNGHHPHQHTTHTHTDPALWRLLATVKELREEDVAWPEEPKGERDKYVTYLCSFMYTYECVYGSKCHPFFHF
jgi:hypothetical protein